MLLLGGFLLLLLFLFFGGGGGGGGERKRGKSINAIFSKKFLLLCIDCFYIVLCLSTQCFVSLLPHGLIVLHILNACWVI